MRSHRSSLRSLPPLAAIVVLLTLLFVPQGPAQEPPAGSEPPPDAQTEPGAPAVGEDSDVVLELKPGQAPLMTLAFPEPETPVALVGDAAAAARELEETLRADLEKTRVFEIQGPWAFTVLTLTGERTRDFEQYRSLGNSLLLSTVMKREGERIVFEGTLYDLEAGESILGKRYRGGFRLARKIAHTFTDEILSYLTSRRGIAQTSIAFASDRDEEGRKEIYLMDYDGYNQRRLTSHRSTSISPSWSADAKGVAYTSFFSGVPGLYYADAWTGAKSTITTEGRLNVTPTLSPDGRRVAFGRSIDGNIDVVVSALDGSNPQRLTSSRAIDTNPAWSPKGNEIAFTSSRTGTPQIYAMDPEGTSVRRLSYEGSYNDNVTWSPDGTKIAYTSRRNGRFQIAVTDVVTLETKTLTDGPASSEDPTYSPDGRLIAFVRKIGGRKQIWTMDAETGARQEQLTRTGNNESPSWSPYSR